MATGNRLAVAGNKRVEIRIRVERRAPRITTHAVTTLNHLCWPTTGATGRRNPRSPQTIVCQKAVPGGVLGRVPGDGVQGGRLRQRATPRHPAERLLWQVNQTPVSGDWVLAASEIRASLRSGAARVPAKSVAGWTGAGRGGRSRSRSRRTTPEPCVAVAPGGKDLFGVPRNELDSGSEERRVGPRTSSRHFRRCGSGRTSANKRGTQLRSRTRRLPSSGVRVSFFEA